MINSAFLFSQQEKIITIQPSQVQVAYASDRLLYSINFGRNWKIYKNLPVSPTVSPIAGGSLTTFDGYSRFLVVFSSGAARRTFTEVNPVEFSTWRFYQNSPSSASVMIAKGIQETVYLESSLIYYGRSGNRYTRRISDESIFYLASLAVVGGTYNQSLYVHLNSFSIYDNYDENFIVQNKALPGVKIAYGFKTANIPVRIKLWLVTGDGSVYLWNDLDPDNFELVGTIPNFSANNRNGKNYGMFGDRRSTLVVATDRIWVSKDAGASWSEKMTLSAPARGVRVGYYDSNFITVLTADGQIFVSDDAGDNFSKTFDDPTAEFVEVDHFDVSEREFDLRNFLNGA